MAEAMTQGLLSKKLLNSKSITVGEPREERRKELEQKHGINVTVDNHEAARSCKILVLAVKPQDLDGVMAGLKGALRSEQMVMSIVAGARIGTISKGLGHSAIVRVMPTRPLRLERE
jgi:pyrroline-5-carboxylate reductase